MGKDIQILLQQIALTHDLRAAEDLVELLKISGAVRQPKKVWAVYIEHKHGEGINVFASEDSAKNYLYSWVCEWWADVAEHSYIDDDGEELLAGQEPPDDPDAAIDIYFEINESFSNGERYLLEETELLGE